MSVLLTAFAETSSEKLIHCFDERYCKLVLMNNKDTSVKQFVDALQENLFDYVISFGQKPVIYDKVYIERVGKLGTSTYKTDFNIERLASLLQAEGFSVRFSVNAGTSFCNHLYANGLKYISESGYRAKMVFVHVPFMKNISDFSVYSERIIRTLGAF